MNIAVSVSGTSSEPLPLPFRQKTRIRILQLLGILLVPPAMFIRPAYGDSVLIDIFQMVGTLLIFIFVMGRCLSILYIGKHKNRKLITTGVYSLCRNPLYLFSMIGVLGFGMLLQSVIYTVFLCSITFCVYYWNIRKEEEFLSVKFGRQFVEYVLRTPRILPTSFTNWHSDSQISIDTKALTRCFCDCLLALSLFPISLLIQYARVELAAYSFVTLW